MAANSELRRVRMSGMFQGFGNLLRKENHLWWRTSRWWKQVVIWLVLLNGLVLLAFKDGSTMQDGTPMPADAWAMAGLVAFIGIGGMLAAGGVVILADDTLLDEKRSGTAAWVLSKPATRPAVILAKLVSYGTGILVTVVLVQAAVAYVAMRHLSGVTVPLQRYAAALALLFLALLFWLTLTVMLSAISNSRGLVMGVPLLLVFCPQLLFRWMPAWMWDIMPWNLTMDAINIRPALTTCLLAGVPLPSWTPIIATVVGCVAFTLIAVRGFQKEEF